MDCSVLDLAASIRRVKGEETRYPARELAYGTAETPQKLAGHTRQPSLQ
jgi:hypothetical protein